MHAIALIVAAFGLVFTKPALAQSYPERNIQFVVPYPAGQTTDVLARVIADDFREIMKATVYVENKGGAGGILGMNFGKQAAPDGYTVLVTASGPTGINPSLYKSLPYDVLNDFTPIGLIGVVPQFIIAKASVPANNLQELIDYIKANPGKLNYGSGGIGLTNHLTMEMFKHAAGLEIVHVPFRGASQAMQGLLGGDVELMVESGPVVIPQMKQGSIKVFATGSRSGSRALPAIPSVEKAGKLPEFDAASWAVMLVPAKTPPAIVEKLHAALVASVAKPKTKELFQTLGVDVTVLSPGATRDFIKTEIERWGKIIREANIPLN